ncbi:MAG: hypothetical protein HY753_05350 [Nitrospirae bacterium]|nr:hypothetical protein [Nitrospirota bacterium]
MFKNKGVYMKFMRVLIAFVLLLFVGCATTTKPKMFTNPSWFTEELKLITDHKSTNDLNHVVTIFIFGFYNNENREKFSPAFINYTSLDLNETKARLTVSLAKEHILFYPSPMIISELFGNNPEIKDQLRQAIDDTLPIIDEYIQTGIFNESKAIKITFPSIVDLSTRNVQWDGRFPSYLVVGLESQMHDKPDHTLGSGIGIVRFSGTGKYTAMSIVPYDFSRIDASILEEKILSNILPIESEVVASIGTKQTK